MYTKHLLLYCLCLILHVYWYLLIKIQMLQSNHSVYIFSYYGGCWYEILINSNVTSIVIGANVGITGLTFRVSCSRTNIWKFNVHWSSHFSFEYCLTLHQRNSAPTTNASWSVTGNCNATESFFNEFWSYPFIFMF